VATLNALPNDVLGGRLITEIESRIDLATLASVQEQEQADRDRLNALLDKSE
jgi:hypothetical protein